MSTIRISLPIVFFILCACLVLLPVSAEDAHTHEFLTPEPYNAAQHVTTCACGALNYEPHVFAAWVLVREPTETSLGIRTSVCTECGALRSEAVAYTVAHEEGHTHAFGEWIPYSAYQHYRVCSCGQIELGAHEAGPGDFIVDYESTPTVHGRGHLKCPLCSAEWETSLLPLADPASSADATPFENPFEDVSATDAYYDAVAYVVGKGLFTGVTPTTFAPATAMTRAMFVTVLSRAAGADLTKYASSFTDVPIAQWYGPAVQWAAEVNLVQGYETGEFRPDAEVTVEQALVILRRFAEYRGISAASVYSLSTYADASDVADWALDAVRWAVERKLYEGVGGSLLPKSPASRAAVAELLYRFSLRYT